MKKIKSLNKKIFISIGLILFIIIAGVIIINSFKKDHLPLKKDEITMEYGEKISLNAKDYLDIQDMEKDEVETLYKKVKVECDAKNEVVVSKDQNGKEVKTKKEYPAVGEYTVTLTYDKDETKTVKVIIKDTTKPNFKDFKESIEITKDCNPKDGELASQFIVEDLSNVTITVDDEMVDYSKSGEYKATVKAVDSSKNEISRETIIKVTEPTIQLDKSNATIYVKANLVLNATIKGKDTKAVFSSSNQDIVSIDENGKVTGIKAGNATITAKANGVEANCKVTVKNIPSGASTKKKTVTNPNTGKQETVVVIEQPKPTTPSGASVSMEALNYINEERAKLGRAPVQYKSILGEAAKIRAKEYARKSSYSDAYYAHLRPDGRNGLTVLYDLNYPNIRGDGKYVHNASECLASGYTSAHNVVLGGDFGHGWKGSSGHWNALMKSEFKYMAIARYGNSWCAIMIAY